MHTHMPVCGVKLARDSHVYVLQDNRWKCTNINAYAMILLLHVCTVCIYVGTYV